SSPRRQRRSRPLLPRTLMAAHARLCTARLRRRRRRVHRQATRGRAVRRKQHPSRPRGNESHGRSLLAMKHHEHHHEHDAAEATAHWHGLRLENRYDGTHETQAPIPVGGRFTYRISFPDPGAYWYHPHIREDYGQELGQYGNILVDPAEPDYWPPTHRELLLTLDDIFIEAGQIAQFSRVATTFAAMGRYGNVMLVAGESAPSFAVQQGEVVRLHLPN